MINIEKVMKMEINFTSVGYIRNNYNNLNNIPGQPYSDEEGHYLEINKEYQSGLKELSRFKYIYVIFYLHKAAKEKLNDIDHKFRIKKEGQDIGVFASREPSRPNNIGLSIVRLIRIKENIVYISGIDALNGTPIIDIKPYIVKLDNHEDANKGWIKEELIMDKKIELYTDGACSGNPGPGGYAALIIKDNEEIIIKGYQPETTNNRMELMAVIEGLKEINKNTSVRLLSDSNYVLQGLEEWLEGWKKRGWKTASNRPVKNKDLWMELDNLSKYYELEFVKVKGHSGNKYNERVDSLAKEQIELNNK
ncbi:ribonuclease HI [Iocasia frigidifontis]|uniref:Ribonuclease H n=2 Tax=Iocasia fonsfrigidae TaxID=2682810 RepID=A0A8A7KGL7_9FIRM|nr:ribonuclease HI [Iocasia fonsfrigidae]